MHLSVPYRRVYHMSLSLEASGIGNDVQIERHCYKNKNTKTEGVKEQTNHHHPDCIQAASAVVIARYVIAS